jgi:hypothetical protein
MRGTSLGRQTAVACGDRAAFGVLVERWQECVCVPVWNGINRDLPRECSAKFRGHTFFGETLGCAAQVYVLKRDRWREGFAKRIDVWRNPPAWQNPRRQPGGPGRPPMDHRPSRVFANRSVRQGAAEKNAGAPLAGGSQRGWRRSHAPGGPGVRSVRQCVPSSGLSLAVARCRRGCMGS